MGTLAAACVAALTLVLGEVYRTISRHLIGKAGLTRTTGATGATAPVFHPVPPPESSELQALVERIGARIGTALERRGLVERDLENAWLGTTRRVTVHPSRTFLSVRR